MSDAVVVFDRVWKKFQRGERHDSLRDMIPAAIRRLTTPRSPEDLDSEEFWALRDVSFEVKKGEALGIIGSNGAGKSTTLKVLTRILRPTLGSCSVRGRTGALIEVAAGFHPDLTGRENVYLQGAIMGMRRGEIERKFDEIVAFSGVGEFIDTQIKRYSSGMNARLGFSIAAHLDPEALIIDEVLSVGDVAFQQRCVERMTEFKRQGVAIVFVSHNLQAVTELCSAALLLDHGAPVMFGNPSEVVAAYSSAAHSQGATAKAAEASITVAFPNQPPGPWMLEPGARVDLEVELLFERPVSDALVGVVVWDLARNLYVYGATSDALGIERIQAEAGERFKFAFAFVAHLARGAYAIEVNIYDRQRQSSIAILMPAKQFSVQETVSYNGVANLYLQGTLVEKNSLAAR
jgi:lipopolysaccharide transport system ATP-binding protein